MRGIVVGLASLSLVAAARASSTLDVVTLARPPFPPPVSSVGPSDRHFVLVSSRYRSPTVPTRCGLLRRRGHRSTSAARSSSSRSGRRGRAPFSSCTGAEARAATSSVPHARAPVRLRLRQVLDASGRRRGRGGDLGEGDRRDPVRRAPALDLRQRDERPKRLHQRDRPRHTRAPLMECSARR
jgi:hypothetical protein